MNLKKAVAFLLAAILLISAAGCGGGTSKAPEAKNAVTENNSKPEDTKKGELFVDIPWLKGNIQNVIVLDARVDKEYNTGHIPGAFNAMWQGFANMEGKSGDQGWGTLLPKEKLAEKLGALGIDSSKTVIVYADPNGWGEDGRILWMLRMAGLTNTKMLDGGWPAWKTAGGETSTDVPAAKPIKLQIAALDGGMNATTEWIKANSNKIKIVDSRAQTEFGGATDFGEKRGGHLPGAINIPFKEVFNDDGTVKATSDLKDLFTKAGLTPEDEIVTYCTKGIRSAHMALLLRSAGFEKARNYDASFYEWAGNDSLQVVK